MADIGLDPNVVDRYDFSCEAHKTNPTYGSLVYIAKESATKYVLTLHSSIFEDIWKLDSRMHPAFLSPP